MPRVRLARNDDLPDIVPLFRLFLAESAHNDADSAEGSEDFVASISDDSVASLTFPTTMSAPGSVQSFVVEDAHSQRILGFASVKGQSADSMAVPGIETCYELLWVYVHRDHRNRGYGKMIMAHIKNRYREQGLFVRVVKSTNASQKHKYWRKSQFSFVSEVTLQTVNEPGLIFAWFGEDDQ